MIEIIGIIASLALPQYILSIRIANETASIGALRSLHTVEIDYRAQNLVYASLTQLCADNLITIDFMNATTSDGALMGYYYNVVPVNTTQFYVVSRPVSNLGTRYFYTDETGVVYSAPVDGATAPTGDSSGLPPTSGSGWAPIGD